MFKLEAPYPSVTTVTLLPDPEFSDGEGNVIEVNIKRSINGTRRTYIKRPGRTQLQWEFEMSEHKAHELRAFIRTYNAEKLRITDHNDRVWIGYFTANPVEFETVTDEWQIVTLEFEGTEVL